jgi:site-specific DNA-methyltransferase (adenine-specific)
MTSAPGLQAQDVRVARLADLTPWPGNPRRHDIEGLRASIRRFGQQRVILIHSETGYIVAGHGTREALMAEGIETGLVAETHLSETEAKAYLLADNQWGERGYNDEDDLAAMLRGLYEEGAVDEALGFVDEDLDKLLRGLEESQPEDDEAPPLPKKVWVKSGDLFQIGRHRLLCGDATQDGSFVRLMDTHEAGMIWTDPPYGVDYEGGTAERLTIANDTPDEVALRALLDAALGLSLQWLRPGGSVYCAAPGGDRSTVFVACLKGLGVYRQTIIWVKDQLVLGRQDYHWRHEPVHVGVKPAAGRTGKPVAKVSSNLHYGWKPGAAHYFVTDRTHDTVWEIARPKRSAEHPTMKPVDLVERSILASSKRNDVILDPFAGSGTTMIAAERTRRAAYVMELDPRYAQVVIERYEQTFGVKAEPIDAAG